MDTIYIGGIKNWAVLRSGKERPDQEVRGQQTKNANLLRDMLVDMTKIKSMLHKVHAIINVSETRKITLPHL